MEPFSLAQVCDRFRSQVRRLLRRLAVSRLLVAVIVLLAGLITLDWYVRFGKPGRLVLLIVFLGVIGFVVFREFVWSVRRKWTDHEVLSYLDAVDPRSRDALVSFYEMGQPDAISETVTPEGRALVEHAVRELASAVDRVQVEDALRKGHVRRWQHAAAALVLAAVLALIPLHAWVITGLTRLFLPLAAVKWPTLTTLEVVRPETGWRIPQGENFRVVTRVEGQRPAELELLYKSQSTDYWITEHVSVDDAGTAIYTFEDVSEPVSFYIRGGDDQTERFHIEVIERPRIKTIIAYYTYPAYARLPNRKIESGQLRGLEGTEVRIDFETSVPVQSASFVLEGKSEEPLTLTSATTFTKTLQLREDGQYSIKLKDLNGFREYRPERYDIQVTPDNPPEVRLLAPGRDLVATSQASLKFLFEVKDDFGLKEVKFMHAIKPNGEPTALTDHITGPIRQTGKESRAEFEWDFSKMEFKKNVDVEYYVVARDCNPTGRGVTESTRYKVSLLTPTDFHLQILYEARKALAEARVAYRNQKKTYFGGIDWAEKFSSGNPEDEKWNDIVESQELAARAAAAVQRWLSDLDEHIARNRMDDAFMKSRLAVIEDLRRGAEEQISSARAVLAKAHPKDSAEAEPTRLKTSRIQALKQASEPQRMAAVGLGRLLRKMYDWENLQTALVNTNLLRERQAEIYETTRQIAPETIGREAEDLDDKTLDQVLALAQQQKAVMEAETNLENQLALIALKADKEGRKAIRRYLLVAYGYLRDIQVNRSLKIVAQKIGDNQLSDVTKDQLDVITAMKVVEAGLVKAGKDVQADEPVSVADLLKREEEDVEVARVQVTTEETGEEGTRFSEAEVKKLLDEVVPMGEDALSQALVTLAEEQDNIRSRTTYLDQTLKPEDMPRYQRLKMGMLKYRQGEALTFATQKVEPLLDKSEYTKRVKPWFGVITGQIAAVQEMLEAANISETNRGFQGDIIEANRDIAQFIARQKRVKDLAGEHTQKGGLDEFNRSYVVKGEDLTNAVRLYEDLDWSRTLQASVGRKSEWLKLQKERPAAPPEVGRLLLKVKDETAQKQENVASELVAAKGVGKAFGQEVREKVEQTGLAELPDQKLAEAARKIRQGEIDRSVRDGQEQAQESMRGVLNRIKELLDERALVAEKEPGVEETEPVRPPTELSPGVTSAPAEKVYYTEEELAKEITPEAIKAGLEATDRIPPEIKSRMLKNLPPTFPEKYRRLVGAYYRTLLETKSGAEKKEGNNR